MEDYIYDCETFLKDKSELALYNMFYDLVIMEERRLQTLDILEDYRLCKALSACYELQDHLANCIAELKQQTESC